MAQAQVISGVCGFVTEIEAQADEDYTVHLQIVSGCAQIKRLAEELTSLPAINEISTAINETQTYRAAAHCRLHASCPVPCAIIKAVEISAGLALPSDVHITLSRD